MCGKDTFYLWDFQTDDNPDGKMPACLGTKSLLISLKIAKKKIKKQFKKRINLYFLQTVHFLLTDNCQLLCFRNKGRKKASSVVYSILQGLRMRYKG